MNNGYEPLQDALKGCYEQAATGKGRERHANDKPFLEQPIFWIEREFPSFQLGQAVKKIHESQRLDPAAAIEELKGAVIFLSAKIITLKEQSVPSRGTKRPRNAFDWGDWETYDEGFTG